MRIGYVCTSSVTADIGLQNTQTSAIYTKVKEITNTVGLDQDELFGCFAEKSGKSRTQKKIAILPYFT
jgi:hypothetical protein